MTWFLCVRLCQSSVPYRRGGPRRNLLAKLGPPAYMMCPVLPPLYFFYAVWMAGVGIWLVVLHAGVESSARPPQGEVCLQPTTGVEGVVGLLGDQKGVMMYYLSIFCRILWLALSLVVTMLR